MTGTGSSTQGVFISFEGGEGCGKTTQRNRLGETLKARGLDVVITREVGGTEGAELLRPVVQGGDVGRWDALSEALLIYGARHDHAEKVIKPGITAGKWVLSDRFFDTTTVYQGYAGGLGMDVLDNIRRAALGNFQPHLTLVFDIDPVRGLERAMQDAATRPVDNTRFERKGLEFHQKVRAGFLDILKNNPDRCVLIDADGTMDEVQQRVWQAISQRYGLKDAA